MQVIISLLNTTVGCLVAHMPLSKSEIGPPSRGVPCVAAKPWVVCTVGLDVGFVIGAVVGCKVGCCVACVAGAG